MPRPVSQPDSKKADALKMAEVKWQQLTDGEKADFVLQTLPNESSDWDSGSWAALTEQQKAVPRYSTHSLISRVVPKVVRGLGRLVTTRRISILEYLGFVLHSRSGVGSQLRRFNNWVALLCRSMARCDSRVV